jgi:hypothetical protein
MGGTFPVWICLLLSVPSFLRFPVWICLLLSVPSFRFASVERFQLGSVCLLHRRHPWVERFQFGYVCFFQCPAFFASQFGYVCFFRCPAFASLRWNVSSLDLFASFSDIQDGTLPVSICLLLQCQLFSDIQDGTLPVSICLLLQCQLSLPQTQFLPLIEILSFLNREGVVKVRL